MGVGERGLGVEAGSPDAAEGDFPRNCHKELEQCSLRNRDFQCPGHARAEDPWTYVHVLFCVLFYWYLLCSRKANFYVIHRR